MQTAVSETWSIIDLHAWQSPLLVSGCSLSEHFHRKHLLDGLDSIVESVEAGCLNFHSLLCYIESVCLVRHFSVQDECNFSVSLGYGALDSGNERKLLGESIDQGLGSFVRSSVIFYVSSCNAESAGLYLYLVRVRHDIDCLYILRGTCRCSKKYRQDNKGLFHYDDLLVFFSLRR